MKIYNPFCKESYDSNFSPSKYTNNFHYFKNSSINEDIYWYTKKVFVVVKNETIRKKIGTHFKRYKRS